MCEAHLVTADKTNKITIKSYVEIDNFVSNTMSYANFVIEACPNLTTLHFDISTSYFYDVKDYFDKLNTLLRSFVDEFLKPLDKGHSELKICLTWTGYKGWGGYEDEAIPQDYELFTIGTELTTDTGDPNEQPDIARLIKVADAKGREHECIVKIFL